MTQVELNDKMMKKTLIDFAPELAIINTDLSTTYSPDTIADSGLKHLGLQFAIEL